MNALKIMNCTLQMGNGLVHKLYFNKAVMKKIKTKRKEAIRSPDPLSRSQSWETPYPMLANGIDFVLSRVTGHGVHLAAGAGVPEETSGI